MSGSPTMDITCKRLSELKTDDEGIVTRVFGHGSFRNRITEMGFVRGKSVRVIKNAPLQDPVEYEIMGYRVALRRAEAGQIEVTASPDRPGLHAKSGGTFRRETINRFLHEAGNVINVALVGNPNSGKTSLFNMMSGAHERVGNYGGVTVDAKESSFRHRGYRINLVDLPGTYSITEYSPEEIFVRTHLLNRMPDVVVNVIDASNLERNLYLTSQLIDMNLKVAGALNMYDELERSGTSVDHDKLGRLLGIPMVPTVASQQKGLGDLFDTVIDVFEDNEPVVRHIHIYYGQDFEDAIGRMQALIWKNSDIVARYSSRYLSIKLLEGDKSTLELLSDCENFDGIRETAARERQRLEKNYGEPPETTMADAKYGFIAGALEETCTHGGVCSKHEKSSRIDRWVTGKVWGLPVFLALMFLTFQATFVLGEIPSEWIGNVVAWIGGWIGRIMDPGPLRDLLADGVVGGVGGVAVFLPNILILFFFISVMEDTGYMARAAFIMDKLMHKMGLHGKSFIPLLMGFGCNVPAIMATRMLESRKDRILTMLIMPFMSCSARLPVYVLLISAFFPRGKGLVLFSIYLVGILIAVISSLIFKRIFFRQEEAPFVMELPPYRVPTGRSVIRHIWYKGSQYLRKMGTVILLASILIWALGRYPQGDPSLTRTEQLERSCIGRMGKAIEPLIRPLGFDWQIGISLLTGAAAKEIVVSTMGVLSDAGEDAATLSENLQKMTYTSGPKAGQLIYSPLVAYTLMLLILLYLPCVAAVAAVRREAGWRWALFTVVYTTCVAWIVSFAVYQIGSLF